MELVHEMTLHCVTKGCRDTRPRAARHAGRRLAVGRTVTGQRINGTMQGAGADWLLIGSDG